MAIVRKSTMLRLIRGPGHRGAQTYKGRAVLDGQPEEQRERQHTDAFRMRRRRLPAL
jgi:hypothetical protein